MPDERTPYRLNQNLARARAAVGLPNASRESEFLDPVDQGAQVLNDVSHLAPVAFSPRYAVRIFEAAANPNRATVQIGPAPIPWLLDWAEVPNDNVEITSLQATFGFAASGLTQAILPTQTLAPLSIPFAQGNTITNIGNGMLLEAGRVYPFALMIEPGTIITAQVAAATASLDINFVIQEFPAGTAETIT